MRAGALRRLAHANSACRLRTRGAEALIVEALERTLADPRGRWLLSAQHQAADSEWRLTGLHEGRIVNVVFDRMLVDEQRTALGRGL